MTRAKTNVFCPVETINRELDFRLFFAAMAVRPDLRFVIGKHFTIFDLLQEAGGGLYLGQNVRPQHRPEAMKQRVRALRRAGTTLVVLDEEGGVMSGDEARWKQWLDFRVDVCDLQPQEHLCAWGDWQREYYRSQNASAASHLHTTGHPRFDLYKERFRSYYDAEKNAWRERYGDFVLINTNFAWSNHFMGEKFVFSENSYYDGRDAQKRLDFLRQWSHTAQVRARMIALVMRLSVEMPEINFVIRPHPSENMESYEIIFADAPNVHVVHEGSVGSWLLACRALIHDGCTTALEAHFCNAPILNYKSARDERYDLMLPNALGQECDSEARVLAALHGLLGGDASIGKTRQLPAAAKELIFNFEGDSFGALINVVHRVADGIAPEGAKSDGVLSRHRKREKVRPLMRGLKAKLLSQPQTSVEKFYGFDAQDMEQRFARVQAVLNKDVRFSMLSSRVFTVEC